MRTGRTGQVITEEEGGVTRELKRTSGGAEPRENVKADRSSRKDWGGSGAEIDHLTHATSPEEFSHGGGGGDGDGDCSPAAIERVSPRDLQTGLGGALVNRW